MPGFNICGYGALDNGPANTYETRRKHRWYFETIGAKNGDLPRNMLMVLKTASRPQYSSEEATMDHNQETSYFAGKSKWEPCKMSYYDVEQDPNVSSECWKWLTGVVNFTKGSKLEVYEPKDYKKNAKLVMINGIGTVNESWFMCGVWPKDVNWQELDYTSSEIMLVEVSMRFDRAYREDK